MWMSGCSSPVCWRQPPCSTVLLLFLCEKSVDYIYMCLFLSYLFHSLDLFVYFLVNNTLSWLLIVILEVGMEMGASATPTSRNSNDTFLLYFLLWSSPTQSGTVSSSSVQRSEDKIILRGKVSGNQTWKTFPMCRHCSEWLASFIHWILMVTRWSW